MGNRYVITGVQLGILMADTDEKSRMKMLNEIMNDQMLEDVFVVKILNKKFALLGETK